MGAISSLGSFAPLGWNTSRGFAKTIASRSAITQYYISANLIDENHFEICKCSTCFFVKEAVKFLNTTKLFKGVEVLNNKEKLQKFSPKLFYLWPSCEMMHKILLFASTTFVGILSIICQYFFFVENKKEHAISLKVALLIMYLCMFFFQFLSNLFVEVCQDFPSMAFLSKVSENHF